MEFRPAIGKRGEWQDLQNATSIKSNKEICIRSLLCSRPPSSAAHCSCLVSIRKMRLFTAELFFT